MTCTLPPADLARVTPALLRGYLEARGWALRLKNKVWEGWWKPTGDGWAMHVEFVHEDHPASVPCEAARDRLIDALKHLTKLEARCPRAVLTDVLGEGETAREVEIAELRAQMADYWILKELRAAHKNVMADSAQTRAENATLQARVATLEAALGWYADEANYDRDGTPYGQDADGTWNDDRGKRAREALGQEATSG